jgi:NAD(P)-dependent dehydrogenase (short-subunit alcohol dehydrogenase family)
MTVPPDTFAGKVVLVTGGGTGIGQATAVMFAEAGATVVVAGRRLEPLQETVEQIRATGAAAASAVPTDLTDSAQVAGLIDTILAEHGRLDIAINNAGINRPGLLTDLDEADWHLILATNLTGVWFAMKHEIKAMQHGGGGVIVNVSSNIGVHKTIPTLGAYAATKAGVHALSRTAAREYIGQGIRINVISPGPIDTHMSRRVGETDADRDRRVAGDSPIGRVGTIAEVASTTVWLASPEASYLVGHDLVLDGGATA